MEQGHVSIKVNGRTTDLQVEKSYLASAGNHRRTILILKGQDGAVPAMKPNDNDLIQIARLIASPPDEKLSRHTKAEKDALMASFSPKVRAGMAYLPQENISVAYNRPARTVYVLPGDARPPILTRAKMALGGLALLAATGLGISLYPEDSNGQRGPIEPKYPNGSLFKGIPARAAADEKQENAPEKPARRMPPVSHVLGDIAPAIFVNPATGEEKGSRPASLKDSRIDCAAATVEGVGNMALVSPHLQVQTDPNSKDTKPLIGMPHKDVEKLVENGKIVVKDPDSGALKDGYVAYIPSLERMEAFLDGIGLGPKDLEWAEETTDPKAVAAAEKFMNAMTCGGALVDPRIIKATEKEGQEKGGVYPPGYALTDVSLATSTPFATKIVREHELGDNLNQQAHVRVVLRPVVDEKTGETKKSVWIGVTSAPEKYEDHLTDSYLRKALKLAQEEGNFSKDHGKGSIEAPRPVATGIMVSRPAQATPGHPEYGMVTAVPEPGSFSLFAAGLAALLGSAFRRSSGGSVQTRTPAPRRREDGPDPSP